MSEQISGRVQAHSPQEQMMRLVLADLQARLIRQPATLDVVFGPGEEEIQTIPGDPRKPFAGVAILNPTQKTIYVGFDGATGLRGGLAVSPFSMLVWPARFVQLSLSVTLEDALNGEGEILVSRLYAAPTQPYAGPFGTPSISTVTTNSPRKVTVKKESIRLLAAHPGRKGLSVQNPGTGVLSLGLGKPAIEGNDIVLEAGQSWDGRIGTMLWQGELTAIATVETNVPVVEV